MLRLNLGCGDRYAPGFINVDHGTPHQVDERVDLTGPLPDEWQDVTHVYAGHLFEHLTRAECVALARRLRERAAPAGCVCVVVGPDVDVARQMIADGTFDRGWGTLDDIVHGAGRWAGDVHQWETTGEAVAEVMREAGWPIVTAFPINVLEGGWPVADTAQLWQYAVRSFTSAETAK